MTDEQIKRYGSLVLMARNELALMIIDYEEEIEGYRRALDISHSKNNELCRAAGNGEQVKQFKDEINQYMKQIADHKEEIEQLRKELQLARNDRECYKNELSKCQNEKWKLSETASYYCKRARISEKFIKKIRQQINTQGGKGICHKS
jgi:chromosome segregation ATPase